METSALESTARRRTWAIAAAAVGAVAFVASVIGLRIALQAAPHRHAAFAALAVLVAVGLTLLVGIVLPGARALPVILMLLAVFLLVPPGVVGDPSWPGIVAADGPVWLSSPGGHLLVAAFIASPIGLLGYQAFAVALIGVAAYVVVMRLPSLAADRGAPAVARVAVAVAVAGVPIAALYRSVNWETTAYAPAVGLLGLALVLVGSVAGPSRERVVELLLGLGVLGVAVGIHPAAVVLVPGGLIIGLVALWRIGASRRVLATIAAAVSVVAGVLIVLLAALVTGRGVTAGDAQGGGDGAMLAADLLGQPHWRMWALALGVAGGGGLCVMLAGALRALTRGEVEEPPALLPAAAVLVLMSLLATWLWGFDLGFPTDADLMAVFGIGVPAAALLGVVALSHRRAHAWLALAAVGAAAVMGTAMAFALAPLPA